MTECTREKRKNRCVHHIFHHPIKCTNLRYWMYVRRHISCYTISVIWFIFFHISSCFTSICSYICLLPPGGNGKHAFYLLFIVSSEKGKFLFSREFSSHSSHSFSLTFSDEKILRPMNNAHLQNVCINIWQIKLDVSRKFEWMNQLYVCIKYSILEIGMALFGWVLIGNSDLFGTTDYFTTAHKIFKHMHTLT